MWIRDKAATQKSIVNELSDTLFVALELKAHAHFIFDSVPYIHQNDQNVQLHNGK